MIKPGISKKTTRFLVVSIGSMSGCLLLAGFLSLGNMHFETVGMKQRQMAEMVSEFIVHDIDIKVSDMYGYLTSGWWHEAVKEANLRYAAWAPAAIMEYMTGMDAAWGPTAEDAPVVQELLSSPMSQRLKSLAVHDATIAEMFLTDQYGGLVGTSGRTTDFFQADELWWQRAYNNGKGNVFFGTLEMDESSGQISIPIAVPMKDEAGQVVGIFKVVLDIPEFLHSLAQYNFGKTGHVALLDQDGDVLHHVGSQPMSTSGVTGDQLKALLGNKAGFAIIRGCRGTRAITTAARVKSAYLKANGMNWVVVVTQEQSEVFFPLYRIFLAGIIFALIFSCLIVFFMKKSIKSILIAPLQAINEGVQHFAHGELDHRIDIKTADEIEGLTTSLNEMAAHLKQTMISRDGLADQIRQREQAEEGLKEIEKQFMDVFYASKDAMLFISGDKFVDCNEAAVRMLGYADREKFLMAHPSQFSPPLQPDGKSSFEKANEMMRLAIKQGVHRFKWVHRTASGEDLLVQVSLTPMIVKGDHVLYCIWNDLTSQERSEQHLREIQSQLKEKTDELEQALQASFKSREILTSMLEDNNQNRDALEENLKELKRSQSMLINSEKLASLGRLVSEIAHEVNNPLMIISGNAQLSLMNESLSAEDKASLEVIMKECQRAKNVIRRVLRFAKPSKGDVKEVDIGECLEGIVGIVEQQFILSHNVHIKKEYLQNKFRISVDEQQIQEVFMNLLNNAKEMMLKGGSITISTSVEGEFLRIDFKDTGPGMSEETMAKIMEPFFTTKETGTGIGLAICYGIVKAHNGDMRFESELGKGTTATVFLPLGGGKLNA